MDAETGMALIMVVQTCLLGWYGYETWKIRKDTGEQNKLIAKQLENAATQNELVGQQLVTMQASLKRTISNEEKQADLHLNWMGENEDFTGYREIRCVNTGGEVEILDVRCNATFSLEPRSFTVNQEVRWIFDSEWNAVLYFGVRYKTRLGDSKERVFVLEYRQKYPKLDLNQPFDHLGKCLKN